MSYTKEQIEYLHNIGLMPDKIYYQVNGKSLQENYTEILRKRQQQYNSDIKQQLYVDQYIDDKLNECVEEALQDIFDKFNSNISITI